jgi:hypothetical protein
MAFNHLSRVLSKYGARTVGILPLEAANLLEPVEGDQLKTHGIHSISCECGAVCISGTEGSNGNKVKEHHHLDKSAVAAVTSNSRKPVSSPGNPDT